MTRLYAGAAVAALVAMIAGTAWFVLRSGPDDAFAACREGGIADGAGTIGGPFTLIDETGATVTDAEVIAEPALIYFGYTFCPDVCPIDVSRNAEAVDILEERGIVVKPVFISIDPARDTPDVLAEFTDVMHPRMIGLTGSDEQVRAASKAYRTYFKIQDPEAENYLVDHSTFTYLMFPERGFADFFRRDVAPEQMADRIACFVEGA